VAGRLVTVALGKTIAMPLVPDPRLPDSVDGVVVGAGANGLVAANLLAQHGWQVAVIEAANEPGGCVRSAQVTAPGFTTDLFSAFYPMAAASPVIRQLSLENYGLRWSHAPHVLAQPSVKGPVVIDRDVATTAASLENLGGDGSAWLRFMEHWNRVSGPLIDAMMSPFPPVRAGVKLLATTGVDELAWWARTAAAPLTAFAAQEFRSEQAALLLAGNALHADFTLDSAGSAVFGVLMAALGQEHGFPVPVGGAGALTDALVRRLAAHGGTVHCGRPVTAIDVRDGGAVAVLTDEGERVVARRAVLADVVAPKLFGDLVPRSMLPRRWQDGLARFEPGWATFKVNWALRSPIPWGDERMHGAGTVHLGLSLDEVKRFARQVSDGWIPGEPFLLVGSMTTADPARSPAGTESAWAYTHVPQRRHRHRALGRGRRRAVRRSGGGADRSDRAGVPGERAGPAHPVAPRSRTGQPEPDRRGDQRGHRPTPPGARPAPRPRPRTGGDPHPPVVPRLGIGPPRRRRPRSTRRQRGARRHRPRPGAPRRRSHGGGRAAPVPYLTGWSVRQSDAGGRAPCAGTRWRSPSQRHSATAAPMPRTHAARPSPTGPMCQRATPPRSSGCFRYST
jgi:phytoene dehydrogenase-like protein